jgi:hypothetical protein
MNTDIAKLCSERLSILGQRKSETNKGRTHFDIQEIMSGMENRMENSFYMLRHKVWKL